MRAQVARERAAVRWQEPVTEGSNQHDPGDQRTPTTANSRSRRPDPASAAASATITQTHRCEHRSDLRCRERSGIAARRRDFALHRDTTLIVSRRGTAVQVDQRSSRRPRPHHHRAGARATGPGRQRRPIQVVTRWRRALAHPKRAAIGSPFCRRSRPLPVPCPPRAISSIADPDAPLDGPLSSRSDDDQAEEYQVIGGAQVDFGGRAARASTLRVTSALGAGRSARRTGDVVVLAVLTPRGARNRSAVHSGSSGGPRTRVRHRWRVCGVQPKPPRRADGARPPPAETEAPPRAPHPHISPSGECAPPPR